jgi:hypothetical protein
VDREEVLKMSQEIHSILSSSDTVEQKTQEIERILREHYTSKDLQAVKSLLIDQATVVPTRAQVYATLAYIFCLPIDDYKRADVIHANPLHRGMDSQMRTPPRSKRR